MFIFLLVHEKKIVVGGAASAGEIFEGEDSLNEFDYGKGK